MRQRAGWEVGDSASPSPQQYRSLLCGFRIVSSPFDKKIYPYKEKCV